MKNGIPMKGWSRRELFLIGVVDLEIWQSGNGCGPSFKFRLTNHQTGKNFVDNFMGKYAKQNAYNKFEFLMKFNEEVLLEFFK
jgi:hypothetical protein